MERRLIHAFALLALSSCLLAGATMARADATDFEYAKGLMNRGYFDLAEAEFLRMRSDESLSSDQQVEGELGLCYLKAKIAIQAYEGRRPGVDPDPIIKKFEAAQAAFNAFFSAHGGHGKIIEAKFELGRLLQNLGALLRSLIEESKDPSELAEYKRLAENAFDEAIALYEAVIQEYEGNEAQEFTYSLARFWKGIAIYNKGLIYPEDDLSRRSTLGTAKVHWEEFIWEYDGFLMGAYGYMYMGLTHYALAEYDDALEYLRTAAGIDVEGDTDVEKNRCRDLILTAAFHIGRLANDVKEVDRGGMPMNYQRLAAGDLVEVFKKVPEARERKTGHLAMLEQAKCYLGIRDFANAIAVAREVSNLAVARSEPWARGTGTLADRLIGEIISEAARGDFDIPQDPEMLWRAAEGKWSQRDFVAAASNYQQVIAACGDDPARLERKIEAWLKVANCFHRAQGDRYYEAAAAAQHVMDTWPDSERAGDAAYFRYITLLNQYRFTKDPADLDLYQGARALLTEKYGQHERARDLQYFEACESLDKGKDLLALNKVAEGKDMLATSQRQFKAVSPNSALFEIAQARLGQVFYELGAVDPSANAKAIETLVAYQKYVKTDAARTTAPERLAKREQALSRAAYFIAKVHEREKKWSDVLASLETFLLEYSNQAEWHANVLLMTLKAHLELGNTADAEKAGMRLWKDHQASIPTSRALYALGRHFDQAQRASKDDTKKTPLLKKAATYYEMWLSLKDLKVQPSEFLRTVGQMYFVLQDYGKAQTFLEKALSKLGNPPIEKVRNILHQLAKIYMRQGNFKEAMPLLERLACIDGDNPAKIKEMREKLLLPPNKVQPSDVQKLLSPSLLYLRDLVVCYGELGGYYSSINLCRRMWRGVRAQTDDWYWARYYYCYMWFVVGCANDSIDGLRNAHESLENLSKLDLIKLCKDAEIRKNLEGLIVKVQRALDTLEAGGSLKNQKPQKPK
jgi:tetratricopeptide (TPR) repeat protein